MEKRPDFIDEENFLEVDIKSIAVDRRFSDVTFHNVKKLEKAQKWFKEAQNLNYAELLIDSDVRQLLRGQEELRKLLEDLLLFDTRTTRDNAQSERDNIQNRIDAYYNGIYQLLPMKILPFLRQEVARASVDVKELEKQQNAAANAEKRYQELAEKLELQLSELEQRREEIQKSEAEVAAVGLGKFFENQARTYKTEKDDWLNKRNITLGLMYAIIGANIVLYFFFFITTKKHAWPFTAPLEFFTLEYAVGKIALLGLLSYTAGFLSKNYNICAGLHANNLHRSNVSETLINALQSPIDQMGKAELMRVGAEAMFSHLSVGYIKKENMGDSGPILEIVKKVFPTSRE